MPRPSRVLIVGAGPVGLISALILARAGVPVLVLEAEPALTRDLRAGSFHPPTQELLAPLGITARMHEIGIKVPRWQQRDREQGLVAEWDLSLLKDDTPYPYRLHLEQHRLTPIVHAMLRELPNAEVRFSTRFTGMTQDADGVTVTAETADGEETFHGAWLIGADGGRSSVRKAVGIAFEGFTWPERYLVVSTPRDLSQYGYASNTYIADPQEWLAIFHMPDTGPPGLWRMAAPVRPEQEEGEVLSDAYAQALIRRFFPVTEDSPIPYKGIYSVHQRVAVQFRAGRVLLAGDAAHVNNPLGGFGLNGGVHDAVNLAEKLSKVMRGEAGESLMDLYVRQRRVTNLEYVQKISIRNKQAMEEKDPAVKRRWIDGQRAIAADPARTREFLLDNSMITSIRRANSIT